MGLIGYGQMGQVAINAKGVKWRLGQKGQVAIKSAGTTLISEQMGHVDMGKMEKLPMGGGAAQGYLWQIWTNSINWAFVKSNCWLSGQQKPHEIAVMANMDNELSWQTGRNNCHGKQRQTTVMANRDKQIVIANNCHGKQRLTIVMTNREKQLSWQTGRNNCHGKQRLTNCYSKQLSWQTETNNCHDKKGETTVMTNREKQLSRQTTVMANREKQL